MLYIIQWMETSMTPEPYRSLERYFARIVNITPEKMTMFEKTKLYFAQQIEKINSLLTKPTTFVEEDPKLYPDGYWAFEIYTPEYHCDGELWPEQHDVLIDPDETTWIEALDKILDVMGKHYGYNIKEQVYYSLTFPHNIEGEAGYGRMLNDEVLQKILLAYPEVYETNVTSFKWKPL
jgi:hypothetical protein